MPRRGEEEEGRGVRGREVHEEGRGERFKKEKGRGVGSMRIKR